jgi:hypothetical protein
MGSLVFAGRLQSEFFTSEKLREIKFWFGGLGN